jgi:hypothetical protein
LEPSLRAVLGEEVEALHPDVRALFASMDRFQMRISVRLHHALGRWAAWAGALLMGQGMYESHLDEVPGRFRLFRREDGSLHFVREFWCEDAVRVFDSDFVVREVGGGATLLEVFQELGVAARMRTERTATGGLSMTVVGLHLRGVPVGVGPFRVRFTSEPGGDGAVDVHGALDLLPRGLLDRWFFGRLLRLPERVGEIRYRAERREATEAVPAG